MSAAVARVVDTGTVGAKVVDAKVLDAKIVDAKVLDAKVLDAKVGQAVRRERILDAAEACFVRNGFHRTTMLDLAREAAMSPGNFYRYFASKEDIVLGLAERDRARGAVMVAEMEQTGDRRAVLSGVLGRYFTGLSREAAVLRLDLWAEATRNPAIAALSTRGEAEARDWLCGMFAALATAPGSDPDALFDAVDPLMKGIIVNLALIAGYDARAAIAHLQAVIDAGLQGPHPQDPEPVAGPAAQSVPETAR